MAPPNLSVPVNIGSTKRYPGKKNYLSYSIAAQMDCGSNPQEILARPEVYMEFQLGLCFVK
jgi:hypothetical protein